MTNRQAQEWVLSAFADLKSIVHLLGDDFLTHIAAFHAQQCVEKCFKAILVNRTGRAPKVHSTLTLYGLISDFLHLDLDTEILTDFDAIYIDARYPGDLGLLPNGKPSQSDAWEFYDFALKVFDETKANIDFDSSVLDDKK